MKTTKMNAQWIRAHWKTDTKRHWPKRASGASGAKRVSGAKRPKSPSGDSIRRRKSTQSNDVDRSVVFKRPLGDETVSDFKDRLAGILRGRDSDANIHCPPRDKCLVRGPNDRGYYPPKR